MPERTPVTMRDYHAHQIGIAVLDVLDAQGLTPTDPKDPEAAYRNLRTCMCGEDASEHTGAGCNGFDPDWEMVRERINTAARAPAEPSVMQDDLRDLMEVLGIPTYARPASPHRVMQDEVIPAVRALRRRSPRRLTPMSAETKERAVSHYPGCWQDRGHHACARDRVRKLAALVKELAHDAAVEADERYPLTQRNLYPSYRRRYERDMDVVRRARAELQETGGDDG